MGRFRLSSSFKQNKDKKWNDKYRLNEEKKLLVEKYIPYVQNKIKKYGKPTNITDELLSAGYLGLVEAVGRYDEKYNVRFATFVGLIVDYYFKRSFREQYKYSEKLRESISVCDDGLTEFLDELMILNENQRELMILLFVNNETRQNSIKIMKKSQSRVSVYYIQAIQKLHDRYYCTYGYGET